MEKMAKFNLANKFHLQFLFFIRHIYFIYGNFRLHKYTTGNFFELTFEVFILLFCCDDVTDPTESF